MKQHVDIETHIGGFAEHEVSQMPVYHHPLREHDFYQEIMDQSLRVRKTFENVANVFGDPNNMARRGVLFEEAIANQMLHGHPTLASQCKKSPARLSIERALIGTKLHVQYILSLDDPMPTFERAAVPDPTDADNLEEASGRGLLMIDDYCRATMQQISQHGGGKTVVISWSEEFEVPQESADE